MFAYIEKLKSHPLNKYAKKKKKKKLNRNVTHDFCKVNDKAARLKNRVTKLVMQRQNVGAVALAITETMFNTLTNLLKLEAGNLKKLEKPEATKRKLRPLLASLICQQKRKNSVNYLLAKKCRD